jgi:hypothetical protein
MARVQQLRLFAPETDAADAGQTEKRLPNRVGVPRGACARRERYLAIDAHDAAP